MKKDKEWLKEELSKQIDILHTTISSGNYVSLVKRAEIMNLIDQLEEPEQEKVVVTENMFWEYMSEQYYFDKESFFEKLKEYNYLKKHSIVEKPVIPQFVADWIEDKKDWTAFEVFYDIDEQNIESDKVSKWLYDNDDEENAKREIVLLQALRSGYTVEKEKRYYVYDKATKSYLGYNAVRTQLNWWTSRLENESFTEQEIKAIDERYWPFAEEVTE